MAFSPINSITYCQHNRAHFSFNLFLFVFGIVSNTHDDKHCSARRIGRIQRTVECEDTGWMYFLMAKDGAPKQHIPTSLCSFYRYKLHCTELRLLRLQMEPSTGGRGAEGVYRLGLWGCTEERLFSVFSIQAKSSKTSSSLLRAAS